MGAELIYRIDGASAKVVNRRLVIAAQGAVQSGGWDRARLRVRQASAPEARTVEVEFLAQPPTRDEVVVHALLPVTATAIAPLPRYGARRVRINAASNSVVVPITR